MKKSLNIKGLEKETLDLWISLYDMHNGDITKFINMCIKYDDGVFNTYLHDAALILLHYATKKTALKLALFAANESLAFCDNNELRSDLKKLLNSVQKVVNYNNKKNRLEALLNLIEINEKANEFRYYSQNRYICATLFYAIASAACEPESNMLFRDSYKAICQGFLVDRSILIKLLKYGTVLLSKQKKYLKNSLNQIIIKSLED